MGDSTRIYERPVNAVTLSAFNMDRTEVTQKDYETLLGVAPWTNFGNYGKGDTYPAWYVNWYDAVLYCNARSKRDGMDTVYSYTSHTGTPGLFSTLYGLSIDISKNGYRLPTEAEWEYACRGGLAGNYYWGESIMESIITLYAWYTSNSLGKSNPVMQKAPNRFGLYDIAGNVLEWCNDWYSSSYYSTSPDINPTGPTNGSYRVQRGGYWASSYTNLRSAYRFYDRPGDETSRAGFRCVQSGAFKDPPTVVAMDDIIAGIGETVTITAAGTSEPGVITTYYWARNGVNYYDTTSTGQYQTGFSIVGDFPILVKVRDDRGLFSQPDTIIISVRNSIPSNLYPANGAIAGSKNVTIRWNSGTYNDHFKLLLDENTPPTIVISSSITDTFYTIPSLSYSKTYYWQVIGINASGQEAAGSIWHFITAGPPPVLKSIAGGSFSMGSTSATNEQPVHTVTILEFMMDSTEVTEKEYLSLMGVNPSGSSGDTLPVRNMTWFDAVLFCNARSQRDGYDKVYTFTGITGIPGNGSTGLSGLTIDYTKNGYRLPTEAEWEYACRAGSSTKYHFGDSESELANYAWYSANANSRTHPVAQKLPNQYGLYDMHGNLFEWCNDWYQSNYYQSSPTQDPTGPATGSQRVTRGGSYGYTASVLRSALRRNYDPDGMDPINGFRCVRRN